MHKGNARNNDTGGARAKNRAWVGLSPAFLDFAANRAEQVDLPKVPQTLPQRIKGDLGRISQDQQDDSIETSEDGKKKRTSMIAT